MGIRTDLIREARELHPDLPGVSEHSERAGRCTVTTIAIEAEEAAEQLDKPRGLYVTLETEALLYGLEQDEADTEAALTESLAAMLPDGPVLVAGLGNRGVTPDGLGPETAARVFITRCIGQEISGLAGAGTRQTAVFCPGVLGTTGIETVQSIASIVHAIQPASLLCIDTLAARRAERIGSSIQLNDSGIQPGSGIGNHREGLTHETLGIPVIALGIPLVAHVAAIVSDTVAAFAKKTAPGDTTALESAIEQTAKERYGALIVTPKEIDTLLRRAAGLLSRSINRALHGEMYGLLRALYR